jgi:hypothetical protein
MGKKGKIGTVNKPVGINQIQGGKLRHACSVTGKRGEREGLRVQEK